MKKLFLATMVALTAMGANAQIARSTMFQAPERENNIMWYIRAGVSINNAAANGNLKDIYKDDDGKTDTGLGSKAGYDIEFGFNKNIGSSDAYWGMEFGFGTRGYSQKFENVRSGNLTGNYTYTATSLEKKSLLAHRFKIMPLMFGYKYGITDKIKLDAHIGAWVSIDMAASYKEESEYSFTNTYDSDYNEFRSEKDSFGIGDLKNSDDEGYYNRFDAGIQAGIGVWYGRWNLDFSYERGFCSIYDFEKMYGKTDKSYSLAASNVLIRLGFAF